MPLANKHANVSLQVGAAFCPMLQELREYLEENPDNAVAPEWSETVRNSVCIKDAIILHDSCD